ncbi:MAG: PAS domain-containing protein [Desulfobacterales bacterium]|nr:PAS domain-containing protein [Desulfobacterales bacterium]
MSTNKTETDTQVCAESIINTIRQPFIVLDQDLRVITASRSFYNFFKVKPEETIGQLVYDLGNKQWDIPKLRELLETILPQETAFDNYKVEHDFETIGRHTMVLNASQMQGLLGKEKIILLAFEDISQRRYYRIKLDKAKIALELNNVSNTRSLEYTQGIINTIRESLLVLDNDLRVLFASRYFYKFFKVKPEETIGKLIYNLGNNRRDMPKLRKLMESILPNQTTIDNYEVELDFRTIGKRIMLFNACQMQGLLGKEKIILLAIEDITEAKRVEEERIKSLARFPSENPNPVLRFSRYGKILYANQSSADLLKKWGKSVNDNVPMGWKKEIKNSYNSGEIVEIEEICEDRTYVFILAPIEEMSYINAYGEDITESKQAEEEIMETKTLLETVVENIPLMIFLKEAKDLRFVLFNHAGEELLGYDRKVLLGKNDLDLFPSEQAAHFIAKDREVLDGEAGTIDIPEEPILTAKKAQRLLHTRKVRIQGADGKTKYLLGISEDITEQKQNQVKLQNSLIKLHETIKGTIETIALIVETRDPYTAGHQTHVSDLAADIAIEMDLTKEQVEGIRMAGRIHDLGKIQVPAEILSKPGKISELEFELIKTHPRVGYDLLKDIEFPWPIAQMVHQHHEKMDGSGYPQGLKGNEIMIEARILVVSDIMEAMSSHRPYRPALGIKKALEQIGQDKGILLDPDVVDACLKLFKEGYQFPED